MTVTTPILLSKILLISPSTPKAITNRIAQLLKELAADCTTEINFRCVETGSEVHPPSCRMGLGGKAAGM